MPSYRGWQPLNAEEAEKGCTWLLGTTARVGDQFVSFIWKGYNYNVANSSRVTTEDLAVHATGYMGVYEADGEGGHVYRRFSLVPRNGRIISSNADGLHSEDLDGEPRSPASPCPAVSRGS